MPASIRCPECNRLLRLPGHLLGQSVQCPSCATIFMATDEANPAPFTPPHMQADQEALPFVQPVRKPAGWSDEDYQAQAPRPTGQPPAGRAPALGSRRSLNPEKARAAVSGTAAGLQLAGVLGIVGAVLLLAAALAWGFEDDVPWAFCNGVSKCLLAFASACWGGIVWTGGARLKNLEAYQSVRISCVVALIPGNVAWPLSLYFGLQALRLLNDYKF
jgi:phage FluMu protein Com